MEDKELYDLCHARLLYRDGKLYRNEEVRHGVKPGIEAGNSSHMYSRVGLNDKIYRAHRLIFLMHHGYLPRMVDHINGDKYDNRIENLRACTNSQNQHNAKLRTDNTSGTKGVYWNKTTSRWYVQVTVKGRTLNLGTYDDLELAEFIADEGREKYHGEYARRT